MPEYLRDLDVFHIESAINERSLRSVDNELLTIPLCRMVYYEKCLTVARTREWNSLPLHIRKLSTIQPFKTAVKAYLLTE